MNRAATIYSVIATIGFLVAIVAAICWGTAAVTHRMHSTQRSIFIFATLVAVLGFAAFLCSYTPTRPQTTPEECVSAVEPCTQADTHAEALARVEPQEAAKSVNPMLDLMMETRPVWSGDNSKSIGTWAFVVTTKADMAEITDQQLHDYLTSVSAEGYNWFNIFFEDGTGLYSTMAGFIEYGTVDRETGGTVVAESATGENVYLFINGRYSNER